MTKARPRPSDIRERRASARDYRGPVSAKPHSATDPNLWVEVDGYPGRLFIMGNPHTFAGRISAWSYDNDESLYFSKSEVTASSDAARWWIEGYLHGAEPSPAAYLVIDPRDVDVMDDDDPRLEQWRDALTHFRESGDMPRDYYARLRGEIEQSTE